MNKKIIKYLNFKKIQQNNNKNSSDKNGKKYLVIMACHCNTELKLNKIRTNLKFFAFQHTHKIVINSSNLSYGNKLSEICGRHNNTKYCEIPNSNYYDFGKWIHVLKNEVNFNDYDYIILTNDSFIIHSSINHFLNLTSKYNVELYGYNDSTQIRYHYQSYLFSLRKDAVQTFINKVTDPNLQIQNKEDVINNFEIKMTDWFSTKKCFLKIANGDGGNIFFTNDTLYFPLKKSGLLPFTKIQRIL
jgi:hypothetical protein